MAEKIRIEKNSVEETLIIPYNLNDFSWFEQIDASGGAIFFACGVFYYFHAEDVKKLFCAMNEKFTGCRLVFDTAGKAALKAMIKGIVKDKAGIDDVDAYFHAGNPEKDIVPWSNGFKVSHRGYMLGYSDLRCESVPRAFRLLSKFADEVMGMKIVRVEFGEEIV